MITTGQRLQGRYIIHEKVGKGGFGVVYRAEDLVTDKIVAVKVITISDVEAAQVLTLLQEARQLARNDHPNIVKVDNFGETSDEAYMVMPFAEGGTLHDKLNRWKALSLDQTSNFLSQIAAGLEVAHTRNVLHRDLKPLNVLMFKPEITEGEEVTWNWNLKISDFGLAKALAEGSQYASTRINGTPTYMAPEQFEGVVSKRSDIYALGITLYQMLAGEPPFRGTQFELMRAHFSKPLPSLADKRDDVSPELQELLEHSTAKSPEQRIASAAELAKEFQRIIAKNPRRSVIPNASFNSTTTAEGTPPPGTEAMTGLYTSPVSTNQQPVPLTSSVIALDRLKLGVAANLFGFYNNIRRGRSLPNLAVFAPEGRFLALGFSDNRLELGAVRNRGTMMPEVRPVPGFSSVVSAVAFEQTGKLGLVGEQSGVISLLDVEAAVIRPVARHSATVSGIIWAANGTVITSSYDGEVKRWRSEATGNLAEDKVLASRNAWATNLVGVYRASGLWAVIAWDDNLLEAIRADGSQRRNILEQFPASFLTAPNDGRWLAAGSSTGEVKLWQQTRSEDLELALVSVPTLPLNAGDVLTVLSFSPRGSWLAAGDSSGALHLLDLTSTNPRWRRAMSIQAGRPEPAGMRCIAWLDNQHLLAAYYDGFLCLEDSERPLPAGMR